MGRSVSVGQYAYKVAYIDISDFGNIEDENGQEEICEFIWQEDFNWFLENLTELLQDKYSSFYEVEEWPHDEARMILKNGFANIQVCTYSGLASVSICLNGDNYDEIDQLAINWIKSISKGFNELIEKNFSALHKQGTFSNGCSVYSFKSQLI